MEHLTTVDENWGVMPVLFRWGNIQIASYPVFVLLAILLAVLVYYIDARKYRQANELSFLIAVGAIFGSALGAKLLEWLIHIDQFNSPNGLWVFMVSGRTIIGGLIGGTLGVRLTKKLIGTKEKRGNLFAPAVALGIAIGRVGCFLNGCCYGQPSHMPWAVDFGDGVARHPTQLYESAFMMAVFVLLRYGIDKEKTAPGLLFNYFLLLYFTFRFAVEFIRVEKMAVWGLTYFQIISVICMAYIVATHYKTITNHLKTIYHGRTIQQRPQ